MATSDDAFDPNDLDSIDALLDEAELEAVVNDSTDDLPEGSSVDAPAMDDVSLDDGADSMNTAPEADLAAERTRENSATNKDEFISKRDTAQTNPLPQMAAQDMDSIKKLIIIFSSILIALVLTGIGIGIWSALAASSAGVDDETVTLIESVKVDSQQGAASLAENTQSVQLVEKKLDALNFQLEQLVTDLVSVPAIKLDAPKSEILDPQAPGTPGVDASPGMSAQVNPQADPAVLSKITAVNTKMIRAQRRIDEVNSRVKSIQAQYQVLLKSVKMVEKQIAMEQLARAEKTEKKKVAEDANPYQYTAPDGMFYDQSVQDSYP
ncbi:MAG: hypothetical protein ACQEQR_04900 [Pseudomonadota bacterium]